MADYFTRFSCILDVGTAENAARAEEIYRQQEAELEEAEGCDLGFDMEADPESGPGALWIFSESYGDTEHVTAFVLACAEAFELTGRWGFTWALTCSKPRLDGFGGGAQVIDLTARKSLNWIDCDHWLAVQLDLKAKPDEGVSF